MNFLQFWPFKDEFFAIFILQGWILCTFYPYGWILCNFYLLEIFFVWKGQKITFLMVNFFEILTFILVIGVFLSGILRVCCFDTNHPFSFGWFVDIFYPSSVYFLQFLPFLDFLGWKWTTNFFVMVNAIKFWYLYKWFWLFYLEFCVGVFFFTQLTLFLFDSLTFFTLSGSIA